ncbi:hypothetical protein PybrP1_000584 [[Pythium] brassicae (nom. inval.)]|nr:hypothetical protein PybrP1_000584 [[Pythium] brassicae (nom. inval.)]
MQPLASLMDAAYTSATRNHASAAMKKFAAFLTRYENGTLSCTIIKNEHVNEDLTGKFAAFLAADTATGFSASTTYLSSVKRQLVEMTRTSFSINRKERYSSLRMALRKTNLELATSRGRPLQDKAPLMTVEDLRVIGARLCARNDCKALKDRALVAFQWAHVGRSSDVGDVVFDSCSGPNVPARPRDSKENKARAHSVGISHCPVLGVRPASRPRCPARRRPDNVSAHINRVLESVRDATGQLQLTPNLKSHSSRRGAAAVAASSSDVNLSDWLTAGAGISTGSTRDFNSDQKVARVLGGWKHPARHIEPPKLEESGATSAKQRAFAVHLFEHYSRRLRRESKDRSSRRCPLQDRKPAGASDRTTAGNVRRAAQPPCGAGGFAEASGYGGRVPPSAADTARARTRTESQDEPLPPSKKPMPELERCQSEPVRRAWPSDLRSLRGWKLSSLLYQVWVDGLIDIPIDPACHAQRDARSAVVIARAVLGNRFPI